MQLHQVTSIMLIWEFVRETYEKTGLSNELVHGLRHMRHVREVCTNICETLDDPQVVKCLRVAVDVHDIGRAIDKSRDHAAVSAKVFLQMPIGDLTAEEFEAVHFAVAYHSKGLRLVGVKRAVSLSEQVLGLLCVCDHADGASPDGAARAARALKGKPILSKRYTAGHLRQIMADGCDPGMMSEYKSDSLVAHLAYNYAAVEQILAPVRHLLSSRYLEEYSAPRTAMYKTIIEVCLALQDEQNILNT